MPSTCDLCDEFAQQLQIATPCFQHYGGRRCFHGRVQTLKVHEDNTLVKQQLAETGDGRILVVDGGGSLRCALVGDLLAAMGETNGWAGIIVYGCARDSAALANIDIGIVALNVHSMRSAKHGVGQLGIKLQFAGVHIKPNDYIYCDEDGLVVAPQRLHT